MQLTLAIQHLNNMKAININGQIKTYNTLPSSWGDIIGGFNLLSNEELKSYGFYDVVIPEYDSRIHTLGDLYFDSASETFTKNVADKIWSETLIQLKENKINYLEEHTNSLLLATDWYYIRQLHRGINVPQEIEDERTAILASHNDHEAAINALTKKVDIIKYEFI